MNEQEKIRDYQKDIETEIEQSLFELSCVRTGLELALGYMNQLEFYHGVKSNNSDYVKQFQNALSCLEGLVEKL